jgi:Cu(I)/Ag(I) efflux system membrane fusion protein
MDRPFSPSETDAGSQAPLEHSPKPSGGRWWLLLRGLEVRLRFVVLVALLAGLFSGWTWLESIWNRLMAGWSPSEPSAAVSPDTEFFCPMDPGVVSSWPAICPICNMDLVPRKKSDAVLLPEGVIARMQLSPYRVQLAGVRTVPVSARRLDYRLTLAGFWQSAEAEGSPAIESPGFLDVAVGPDDAELFNEPRPAMLTSHEESRLEIPAIATRQSDRAVGNGVVVRIQPKDNVAHLALQPGMAVRATLTIPAAALSKSETPSDSPSEEVLAVPASAVVQHSGQQLVYVEVMPGMFDGVLVELGRRCGDMYPVVSGLEADQQIVAVGAFLLDAESRLNPSLAVQYFGANAKRAEARIPPLPTRRATPSTQPLSKEDQALAQAQRICPVTEKPLDSMGGPVIVTVKGRKVFICCKGCERPLLASPDKYLERIAEPVGQ